VGKRISKPQQQQQQQTQAGRLVGGAADEVDLVGGAADEVRPVDAAANEVKKKKKRKDRLDDGLTKAYLPKNNRLENYIVIYVISTNVLGLNKQP